MSPQPIGDFRDLTRYRKVLIRKRIREANRPPRVLQDAGITRASASPDIPRACCRLGRRHWY